MDADKSDYPLWTSHPIWFIRIRQR